MGRGTGNRIGRMVLAAAMAALLGAAAPMAADAGEMGKERFSPGEKAPDFTAADLKGADVRLSAFAGQKVVLLNFWGLRCGACLEEMPYLDELARGYGDRGLAILGVNTDGVDAPLVLETLKEVQVSVGYPLLVDPDFKVTDMYTNFLVPLTLVIDRDGVIRYIHTGFEKGAEKDYEKAVREALGS